MKQAASVARIIAIVVSLLYMLLLLPHISGIEAEKFLSGWFIGAVVIALSWIPLVWFHRSFKRHDGPLRLGLSFAPLILFGVYFGTLFAVA